MINKYTLLFLGFICAYTTLFLISPAFGPIDDYVFLRTVEKGVIHFFHSSNFPYINFIEIGRFIPLGGIEYNLILLFLCKSFPFWYYLIHAFQFILLVFLLVKILQNFVIDKKNIYLTIAVFVLTPGFVYSWFRLGFCERNMVFFLAVFLYLYFSYIKNSKTLYLILAAVTANLIIYYRETAFIMMGTFSAVYLLLGWKNMEKKLKLFHAVIVFSALIYVAVYGIFVLPYARVLAYGRSDTPVTVGVKNLLNYSFVSDPVIIFLVGPLTIWRLYKFFLCKEKAEPLYDSLLLASLAYALSYFVLNLYSVYYFQPAYIFAIPPLFYYLAKEYHRLIWKCFGLVAGILLMFNSLPTGLHNLTYFKYMPANFNSTLDFVMKDIKATHQREKADVYIAGASCGSRKFLYFLYSEYFLHKGLYSNEFDLKSNMENDVQVEGYFPYLGKIPTPYTVFEHCPSPVSKGAYLIVGPNSTEGSTFYTEEYIKSLDLDKNYKLVFSTKSPLAFPMVNLKVLGRYLISKSGQHNERLFTISRHQPSMEWPDYYVYVRK